MVGPLDDNLVSQTISTLIPLCIGAAVLTTLYQIGVWIVGAVRRRIVQRETHRHRIGPV